MFLQSNLSVMHRGSVHTQAAAASSRERKSVQVYCQRRARHFLDLSRVPPGTHLESVAVADGHREYRPGDLGTGEHFAVAETGCRL